MTQTTTLPTTALLPLILVNLTTVAGAYAFITIAGPMAYLMNLQAWHIGLIISTVGVVWMVTARFWGHIADIRGRVFTLRVAVIGFTVSYLLLAFYVWWVLNNREHTIPAVSLSITLLLLTRAALGGFFAGLPVAAIAWIADNTTIHSRTSAIARFASAGSVGLILAPPLAGWIGQYDLSLALLFFALLPLIGLPWLSRLHARSPAPQTSPSRRSLKMGDARIRQPWISALTLYSAIIIVNTCLGFYVIDALHVAPDDAAAVVGYTLGSAGVGLILAQLTVGKLPQVPPIQWLRWGTLIGAAGFSSILLAREAQMLILPLGCFIAAMGMGVSFPSVAALASNAVTAPEQGACAGAMSAAQGLSMIIAPFLGAALYDMQPIAPFVLISALLVLVSCTTWLQQYSPSSTTV